MSSPTTPSPSLPAPSTSSPSTSPPPLPELAPPHLPRRPRSAQARAALPLLELVRSTDGAPLRQATRARLAWLGAATSEDRPADATSTAGGAPVLWVRFECVDVDAWGTYAQRDAPLWTEEVVEIFLAPGTATPSRYVEIEVSPRGALFDAWVDNPDGRRDTLRVAPEWDCPGLEWRTGAAPSANPQSQDWWAEIAIPLAALVPEDAPLPPTWRVNLHRVERPRRGELPEEYAAWSPTLRDPPDFHVPARFGVLHWSPPRP